MKSLNHKIPLKLKLIRFKNSRYLKFIDDIIYFVKPPKKFSGVPKKILFIRNDRIGDAVVTLPVLRDLKLNYPEIEIHVLASERNRFVFDNANYIGEVIIFSPSNWQQENLSSILKIPLLGRMLQFIFYFLIPYYFNKEFREKILNLKKRKYDVVVDLVGSRRLAILGKMISDYTVGSRLFGLSWLYSYYMKKNWVSQNDTDFMSRKIEKILLDAFEFKFEKRNTSLSFKENVYSASEEKEFDVFIHLGTSELRKLNFETENKIIDSFKNKKLLITDIAETKRFIFYKKTYREFENVKFKLYENLEDVKNDVVKAKLLLCYDGGQSHYLSQYVKTLTIFGPASVPLWKPYEFEDYRVLKEWSNGVKAIQSQGKFHHTVIYFPIWCSPCFDIGCKTKPCLENIQLGQLKELIESQIN